MARSRLIQSILMLGAIAFSGRAHPAEFPQFPSFKQVVIDAESGVVPAVAIADIDGGGRPDIVAVTNGAVAWYENPSWERHQISGPIKGLNVCIALRDLDGDGLPEIALGADWQFENTISGGSLHYLWRGTNVRKPWNIRDLTTEPSIHRIRWADTDGDGKPELLVAPLKGRGSTPPNFKESAARLMLFHPPADPKTQPWDMEPISEQLHVLHNIFVLPTSGRDSILGASLEGVSLFRRKPDRSWSAKLLVEGNPQPWPQSGAGEIKVGWLGKDIPALAAIEPWHGTQAVVYVPDALGPVESQESWTRVVLDDTLAGGHAVAWADFDGDGWDELVVGFRDKAGKDQKPGLHLYDLAPSGTRERRLAFQKVLLDDGGMATEDVAVGDLNGDGRPDVVASGRATHNIKLYENLGLRP